MEMERGIRRSVVEGVERKGREVVRDLLVRFVSYLSVDRSVNVFQEGDERDGEVELPRGDGEEEVIEEDMDVEVE